MHVVSSSSTASRAGRRRWRERALLGGTLLVALIGAGAVGWWSAGIASRPVATLPEPSDDIWFTVEEGEVGSTREVPVTGQWDAAATVTAAAAGVLTERLADDGATVESGSVVGTVDLQPIVVAEGAVPSFRTLSRNARGQDVAQLQELLVAQGLLASDAIDGAFGRATEQAVSDWEENLGLDATGTVPLGRLMFVPGLPARARWLADVGDSISPGMPLLELLDASPRFSATVSPMSTSSPQTRICRQGSERARPAMRTSSRCDWLPATTVPCAPPRAHRSTSSARPASRVASRSCLPPRVPASPSQPSPSMTKGRRRSPSAMRASDRSRCSPPPAGSPSSTVCPWAMPC